MHTPRPNPWKMGMAASMLCPGSNVVAMAMVCVPRALKLRLESRMPFVTPVVPPRTG